VHRISFFAWLLFIAIQVLAYVPRLHRLLAAEARGVSLPHGKTGGHAGAGRHARRARWKSSPTVAPRLALLTAALLAGLVIALPIVHLTGNGRAFPGRGMGQPESAGIGPPSPRLTRSITNA